MTAGSTAEPGNDPERFPRHGPAGPPTASRALARAIAPIEALFDRIFTARWSPIYQSGALTVLFLAVASLTGIYLFLFYEISDPHGSVAAIESSIWGGSWIRSLHRYSADLAVVAALVHLVKKLAQGHTWGPRAASWVSGVLLLGMVFLCGWTGLVMAWDVQAQLLAVEGARLMDLLPVFSEPIGRTFSGGGQMGSGFFFMNLFLHVAIPLGVAFALYLHISRVARPTLMPPKKLLWGALGALGLAGLAFPVPLAPEADLLALPGEVPVDLFYTFWLPIARRIPAAAHLVLWVAGLLVLLTLPRWWRPRHAAVVTSRVDETRCTGCTQCYLDCPYDAIAMVPRTEPSSLSELVARVDPDRCVGCGICIGSCAPMGVGPGKTGRDELREVEVFLAAQRPGSEDVVVLACGFRDRPDLAHLEGVIPWETGCSGSVHTSVLEVILRRGVGGVYVLTCHGRDCLFREGPRWLGERVWNDREAELRDRVDKRRVAVGSFAGSEGKAVLEAVTTFRDRIRALEAGTREDRVELEMECEVPDDAVAS